MFLLIIHNLFSFPGEDPPSLKEAVRILQIREIETLKEIIEEKNAEIQTLENDKAVQKLELENKAEILQQKIDQQASDVSASKTLVNFMTNVIKNSAQLMEERGQIIATQAEELEACKIKVQHMEPLVESMAILGNTTDNLRNIISISQKLNKTYCDIESAKPTQDCDLPSYVATMADALSDQEKEID